MSVVLCPIAPNPSGSSSERLITDVGQEDLTVRADLRHLTISVRWLNNLAGRIRHRLQLTPRVITVLRHKLLVSDLLGLARYSTLAIVNPAGCACVIGHLRHTTQTVGSLIITERDGTIRERYGFKSVKFVIAVHVCHIASVNETDGIYRVVRFV